jgi:uncharacterized membrane protein YfcA
MPAMVYAWLVLVGLVAGFSGGLLGIGGSTVMIPGMILILGPTGQHLYQAAAMIVNFFVVGPAVLRHGAAGAVLRPITRWMAPSAVVGAIAGVFASELPAFRGAGQGYLQIAFSAFLFYAIVYNLFRLGTRKRLPPMTAADAARLPRAVIVLLVGLPAGLAGGLLGVGGGLVAVPAQQVFLRVPLTHAIANSASTILWSSLVGAAVKHAHLSQHGYRLRDSLFLALCLIPSAIVGSWVSAGKVHTWPVGIIRGAFVVLMLYCGTEVFMLGLEQVGRK